MLPAGRLRQGPQERPARALSGRVPPPPVGRSRRPCRGELRRLALRHAATAANRGARGVRCSGTPAAGPRQACLHGLDQSGRVLPGKHCLHAAGRPHRATPRSRHVRPRSAPRRSHAASTRPHAHPRCDAPSPCGSTGGRPSRRSRHAGSAPPCRGATGPGRTHPPRGHPPETPPAGRPSSHVG